MSKNQSKYAPNERGYLEQKQKKVKAYSKSGKDFTELPDNVTDPIVSNNIINAELDYTKDSEINVEE